MVMVRSTNVRVYVVVLQVKATSREHCRYCKGNDHWSTNCPYKVRIFLFTYWRCEDLVCDLT